MGRDLRFAQRVVFCLGGLTWLGLSILAVLALSSALPGQTSQDVTSEDSQAVVHLPTDWSHHHLVYSNPATAEQLKRAQQDPRYWQQLFHRSQQTPPHAELDIAPPFELPPGAKTSSASKNPKLKRDWSENMGTGATVGAGQYPGKFGFDVTTFSCANDYVVFNTGLAGSGTQASIIAYNSLYSGCGGTVPSVYWAYNTGGTITSSVTLSEDGTQLAFVQAPAGGGAAALVLLKWATPGGGAGAPGTITTTSASNYRNCTAPCMTTIAFKSTAGTDPTPTDSYSAPFYDFSGSDNLYVGDNAGYLHQFTGVFEATPKENTAAPWPVQVATAPLSSPIYDPTSGNVFVTTSWQLSNNSGARLVAVCASATCAVGSNGNQAVGIGTTTPSNVLGPTTSAGSACHGTGASGDTSLSMRLDAPLVDPVAGKVYAFLGNDGNANSAVIQFSTTVGTATGDFAYHSCGTEETIGTASTGNGTTPIIPVFAGTFDNAYFNSTGGTPPGSSPSGNLYVCGNTSGDPTLYQVPIASNAMGTAASVTAVSSRKTTCSPVTEVYNSTNDLIFLSADTRGTSPTCGTSGCVYSTNVTPWQRSTAYAVGQEVLDTHLQIQVVETAGTSAAAAPVWSTTIAGTVTDGTVKWLNQGPLSTTIGAAAFATFSFYGTGTVVIDGNGNIELCNNAGIGCFNTSTPTWQTAPGATTSSGGPWENLGADGIPALTATGGTSGIIPDNTVPPGAIGTSQVYYSTLTGSNAVQASQLGLE